jgi:NADPH:quinone reductase-like Zn-dependent oxidoreductase
MTQSDQIRAIVVDQAAPGRLVVRPAPLAPAAPGDLTIRVTAISLNRGEVKRALTVTETGTRPGWDFVGVVDDAGGAEGRPMVGSRVAGLLPIGAWAESIRAPATALATVPDGVTDAQAATLPLAGLTALHALRKGGCCSVARSSSTERPEGWATWPSNSLPRPARASTGTSAGKTCESPSKPGARALDQRQARGLRGR